MLDTGLARFRSDAEYVDAHRNELLARYPECWVAVFNGRVVADDPDLDGMLKKLRDRGIPPSHVYRAYLSTREELLLLATGLR
jgi:hypothetical protein